MRIAYLQFNVHYKDPFRNIDTIVSSMDSHGADLFVTPELCLTGYLFGSGAELGGLLENNAEYLRTLSAACKRNRCSLVLGHASKEGGNLYNTAFVLGADGVIGTYNKIHLSKLEQGIFTEGRDIPVFSINNVNIGINICYDLWIPELSRLLFHKRVHVVCCPCNFGGPWTYDIARTRAMENKAYYIVANRVGTEKSVEVEAHFRGESRAFDYRGDTMSEVQTDEGIGFADIDITGVESRETIMSNDISAEANKYQILARGESG